MIPSQITYKGISYNVTSIGDSAFWQCSSMTSIKLPSSVTSIGDSAFWQCSGLISVEIPSSVTSIGARAFKYCTSLVSIVIPKEVTSMGKEAFHVCDVLKIYCEAESKPSGWASDWNISSRPVVWGYNKSE